MRRVSVYLPIRIQSVANLREHWRVRHRRGHQERLVVAAKLKPLLASPVSPPIKVTITRVAPRLLDTDNAWSGCKAIRDEVARLLQIDDGAKGALWDVQQEKGKPREYGCRILIEGAA